MHRCILRHLEPLTRYCVFITVTLTDADQERSIFVLGSEKQLLSFHTVDVPIVPPRQGGQGMKGREDEETYKNTSMNKNVKKSDMRRVKMFPSS